MKMKLVRVKRGDDDFSSKYDVMDKFLLSKERELDALNRDPSVDVDFRRNYASGNLQATVNWAAKGDKDWREAKKFAENILRLCVGLEHAEKEARRKFPQLK